MTTIRPNVFPQQPPPGGQRDDAGHLSAQRAFFQAVTGQGQAQAAAAPAATTPAAPLEAPQAVNRVAQASPADTPQKILRPGSLLDIRV